MVRNGNHRPREVMTSAGAVQIRQPRVSNKRTDETTSERLRFSSAIPAWSRRSPRVAEVLPLLYLHGLSSNGRVLALVLVGVIHRIEDHLAAYVGPVCDALLFTASRCGPLFRSRFARHVWQPAGARSGLDGITFYGLRHSFVAILVAVGCNVGKCRSGPATTALRSPLTRYGGLFEDGSAEAVYRLDALLGAPVAAPTPPQCPLEAVGRGLRDDRR